MAKRLHKSFLVLLMGLLLTVASTAYAAPTDRGESATACGTGASAKAVEYLPVSRWADATTSFHSRLDADTWNDLAEKVQRNGVDSTYMQVGNAAWRLGTDALYASSTFCPIDTLGYPLDSLVGIVGDALSEAGIFALLIVATVVTAVLSLRKGRDLGYVAKEVFKTGAALGVLSGMILGAAASTQDAPGTGSPWWWVNQTNTVVNALSGTIAQSAVDTSGDLMGYQNLASDTGNPEDWPVTCITTDDEGYIDYLRGRYDEVYAKDGSPEARAAALPAMVSSMWEASVLPVWAAAQYGTGNNYSDHVFCFFLEARSLGTRSDKAEMRRYLEGATGASEDELVEWQSKTRSLTASGGNTEDQGLIGWGACIPSGATDATVRGNWANIEKKIAEEDCKHWWAGGDNLHDSSLDWDDGDGTVINGVKSDSADTSDIYNYISTVHGKDGTTLGSIMVVYLIGSLVNSFVLLLLAVLQFASKLVLAFMVVGLFAALARSLAPGDDAELFKRTGLQLIGAAFVSSCAGLMIAIIMVVAGAVTKVGSDTFSPGTAGAIIAACTGPAIGTYLLHWVFTSVLRVPSPFTVKGAMSWGKGITTGVVGGAVGGAVVGMASNARTAAAGAMGRNDKAPQSTKPGQIDPAKNPEGRNRSIFTSRSRSEALARGAERLKNRRSRSEENKPSLLERAQADEALRKDKKEQRVGDLRAEAKRLADNDGHLGQDQAWKGYTGRARSNLRRARAQELRASFNNAAHGALNGAATRARQGARQVAGRVSQGADAARTIGSWAAHHPARAAAAAGAAGWRGAAASARTAAAGATALRHMPAKKAVVTGAGAALAVGAPTAAAGILAAGAGTAWARGAAQALRQGAHTPAPPANMAPEPADQEAPTVMFPPIHAPAEPAEAPPDIPQEPQAPAAPAAPVAPTAPTLVGSEPPQYPAGAVDRAQAAAQAVQAQQERADTLARQALDRARANAVPRYGRGATTPGPRRVR